MSFAAYIVGIALLGLATAPVVWGSIRLRRRILPTYSGAPARLAESIVALTVACALSQLLGSFGGFRRAPLVAALAGSGLIMARLGRGRPAARDRGSVAGADEPITQILPVGLRRVSVVVAIVAVAIIAGGWTTRTAASLSRGIGHQDSQTYHLPHAARFHQDGWVTRIHFTDPDFPDAFHPSNVELLHGVGMVIIRRDLLSPVMNLGWAALALLAAWCIGRRAGVAPMTMTAAALVLASPVVSFQNAGSASNDVAVLFFLLAAVALLVQPRAGPAATSLAALAAGLALSTKLTAGIPVVALTIGVVIVLRRWGWKRLALAWIAPMIGTGAFWYVRNLVHSGTPSPTLPLGAGPLPFTSPRFDIVERFGFSVADYLGDSGAWRDWILPGLRADFGSTWWLALGLLAAGATLAVTARDNALLRVFGAVALAGAIGYVITPTTALGPKGELLLFAANLIYLTPALIVGIVILPLVPALRRPVPGTVLLTLMAVAIVASQVTSDIPAWGPAFRPLGIGIAVGAVVAGCAAMLRNRWTSMRRVFAGVAIATVAALALAGYPIARTYLTDPFAEAPMWKWARNLTDERIAIAGFGPQYPLYGRLLENYVQYVGEEGPNGEFTSVRDCAAWRAALRRGRFTYVMLKPERLTTDVVRREIPWTRSDPAATSMPRAGDAEVFRFDPTVADPGCASGVG